MNKLKMALMGVALIFSAGTAMAGQCGYDYCWGAVGVGPGNAWGFSHGYASEQQAWNAVQGECGGDCDNIHTFYNACGAIAMASDGSWGFDWGYSQGEAESKALGQCNRYGPDCSIRVWACSP